MGVMKVPEEMRFFSEPCQRYARVLLSLPKEFRDQVHKEISMFCRWAESDVEGWRFLSSAFLPIDARESFLDLFCDHHACHTGTRNFFRLLAHYDRISILPDILACFDRLIEEESGKQIVYLVSSHPLPQKDRDKVEAFLGKILKGNIRLHESEDSSLLLGAVLLWGGFMVDASLNARLQNIKKGVRTWRHQN